MDGPFGENTNSPYSWNKNKTNTGSRSFSLRCDAQKKSLYVRLRVIKRLLSAHQVYSTEKYRKNTLLLVLARKQFFW